MAVSEGSCKFGWWFVHVRWSGDLVEQVRFARTPLEGDIPVPLQRYLAGKARDTGSLRSFATEGDSLYAKIYRVVREIPYGSTATYGEIAAMAGTGPRVVGNAMARNPTPLIVPCHRVVGAHGPGGFSPSLEIKQDLLELEKKGLRKTGSGSGP